MLKPRKRLPKSRIADDDGASLGCNILVNSGWHYGKHASISNVEIRGYQCKYLALHFLLFCGSIYFSYYVSFNAYS
ncbi:hypothetical protein HNR39_000085 [Glaciimonas immobilis]|uniref:Uncharacterized protein n=1 Tax=Glaciimonas immobilis TaxID=728004 RepID=A0A840RKV4_9BURK|nr:hypothetical protein [Glaciimonas immobilis]